MGRKPIYTDDEIAFIIASEPHEIQRRYPKKSIQNCRAIKRYYMEKQPNEPEKRLYKTWETSAFNKETQEWETTTNHGYEFIHDTRKELIVAPVVPAIIKMSRAKIPKRDHEVIFVISDAQIGYRRIEDELVPIHDERAINAALKLANDLRPNFVVDCGDTIDLAELGKYNPKDNHFLGTLQPSLQRTHDMFAEFTAATPGAERHTVDSNHTKRLGDYVLRNAFELFNIKAPDEKYPALSVPGLLKLDDLGWEWHGGYGLAEYEHKPDLAFLHGTDSVSQGSTAAKLGKKNHDRNIIQGHAHRMETQYHTDRHGRMFGAFVVGALCRRDGYVPSYWSAVDQFNQPVRKNENWQNGVMVIRDYGDGKYQFDHVPIWDGVIHYGGRTYKGDES